MPANRCGTAVAAGCGAGGGGRGRARALRRAARAPDGAPLARLRRHAPVGLCARARSASGVRREMAAGGVDRNGPRGGGGAAGGCGGARGPRGGAGADATGGAARLRCTGARDGACGERGHEREDGRDAAGRGERSQGLGGCPGERDMSVIVARRPARKRRCAPVDERRAVRATGPPRPGGASARAHLYEQLFRPERRLACSLHLEPEE
jgi:hypothetical protein